MAIISDDDLYIQTQRRTRERIAATLEILAKMVRDGDETTIEIDEAREALQELSTLEPF